MASGDCSRRQYVTFYKSDVPIIGAVIDFVETSFQYICIKAFAHVEKFYLRTTNVTISATFMALVCLIFGLVVNVKLEVVKMDERPLPNDLHIVLLSDKYKLYVDEIDVSKVLCCIEASDLLLIIISCILIWNTSYMRSPASEYMFLPWLGASLRGILLRQAPSCVGLLYTMFVANGSTNKMFLTSFTLLTVAELRLWLEIVRLVCSRWRNQDAVRDPTGMENEAQTISNSNDEVPSFEVSNYVY